ncbi:MAG: DUF1549 domain-containing protein, partial [Planctomycetia bacterium]
MKTIPSVGLPIACLLLVLAEARPAEAAPVDFNRDVRPILSDYCFSCHGPDASHREADLRLDTRDGLFRPAADEKTLAVVVPGKPTASELWRRVASHDADEKMPPPAFPKELSNEDRETLRRWIEQGAPWEGHWAFQPIDRPTAATKAPADFRRNDVDDFLAAGLQAEGYAPSPPADPAVLLRRVTFDLTGLPPKPADLDAFLADRRSDAYERVVDRLLASPEYGERLAIWWLDLVRYADTVGYHGDQPVSVYPFREYVIEAFAKNKPFDVFTREQLAGDLTPNPTLEQQVAAGYNRLGMMSAEGGVQPKEYLAKYIAERVRNLGGAWLGLTLGCCECHDHKFDPLATREFYAFEAFFADVEEQGLYSGDHASG